MVKNYETLAKTKKTERKKWKELNPDEVRTEIDDKSRVKSGTNYIHDGCHIALVLGQAC